MRSPLPLLGEELTQRRPGELGVRLDGQRRTFYVVNEAWHGHAGISMHGNQPGATGIFQNCQVTSDGNSTKRTAQPTLAWSVACNDLTQLGIVVKDLVANLRAT